MDGSGKWIAGATVLGAVISAIATYQAARLGLVRPSTEQIIDSKQYKALVDDSAKKIVEIGELEQHIRALVIENQSLQDDLLAAKSIQAPTVPKGEEPVGFESSRQTSSDIRAPLPVTEHQSEQSGVPLPAQRKQFTLTKQSPVILSDETTITLKRVHTDGAAIVMNGRNQPTRTIGSRLDVPSSREKSCFIEVMSMSSPEAEPQTLSFDYVCAQRRL